MVSGPEVIRKQLAPKYGMLGYKAAILLECSLRVAQPPAGYLGNFNFFLTLTGLHRCRGQTIVGGSSLLLPCRPQAWVSASPAPAEEFKQCYLTT